MHKINGHQFQSITYNTITLCNFCDKLLWGIGPQGYQCQSKRLRILASRSLALDRRNLSEDRHNLQNNYSSKHATLSQRWYNVVCMSTTLLQRWNNVINACWGVIYFNNQLEKKNRKEAYYSIEMCDNGWSSISPAKPKSLRLAWSAQLSSIESLVISNEIHGHFYGEINWKIGIPTMV